MDNIIYENGSLKILDQTLLPNEEKYITMKSLEECIETIKKLRIRGAPAIGIFAGYSLALFNGGDIKAAKAALDAARPTAVNLSWATARIAEAAKAGKILLPKQKPFMLKTLSFAEK